jgi:serine protease Do
MPTGQSGAVITDVDPDSGSAAVGLQPGDVILSVNRVRVSSATEAARELQKIASGRLAQLLLWRDGKQLFVTVKKD